MSNKEGSDLLKSCVEYFKSQKVYYRVFGQMQKNWKKYGRASGYIKLEKVTFEEQQALSGFLGKPFYGEIIRFHMSAFEQALMSTRFKEVTLKDLLEKYFAEELVTNREMKENIDAKKAVFFQSLYEQTKKVFGRSSLAAKWLWEMIQQRKYGYQLLSGDVLCSEEAVRDSVWKVCQALDLLENRAATIRLALLGAEITLNPHAFDQGTTEGKLLIQALSCNYQTSQIRNREDVFMLYHKAGIRPDDISSFTTAYGIALYTNECEHMAYRSYINNKEPYVVTLSNLSRITRANCKSKCVYVIENQMVFSHMCEELAETAVSLLCTSGQVKTASLILLDLLCEAGCRIFYSGDFDPEGLNIADKILRRNQNIIVPWHMTREDYSHSLSNEILTEERLQKLHSIQDSRLIDTRDAILYEKRAGYQEHLIQILIEEIKELETKCNE